MAFNNGSFGNNNFGNQNNGEAPQRKSWKVGKDLYASDAKITVGLYESPHGTPFCSLLITSSIGKDPNTGMNAYEQRPPMDMPSILIGHELLEAIIDHFTDKTRSTMDREYFPNWVSPTGVNEVIDCGHGSKLTINGSDTDVKIKVEKEGKGERTATITGIKLSNGTDIAGWRMLLQRMFYVLSYMGTAGIDAEKFSAAMGATAGGVTLTPDNDNLPI